MAQDDDNTGMTALAIIILLVAVAVILLTLFPIGALATFGVYLLVVIVGAGAAYVFFWRPRQQR